MKADAILFTIKTVLRKLIDLFPLNRVPDVHPTSREGILFNKIMKEVMYNAEVNLKQVNADPENFMVFSEAMRKIILYLMEKDGYYRKYVAMFFDKVKREW